MENNILKRMEKKPSRNWRKHLRTNLLSILTVLGVLAGVALGAILRSAKEEWTQREISYVNILGDLFLRMLKGLILPLIVTSLVAAIASLDMSLSGKIGGRAIVYYMVTTICAVILGIILVTTIKPGEGRDDADKMIKELKTNGDDRVNGLTVDTLLDLVRYNNYHPCPYSITFLQ